MQYQISRKLQKGGKFNLDKLKKELVSKSNNKQEATVAKKDMLKAKNNRKSVTVVKVQDTKTPTVDRKVFKDYKISSHFVQRAQERFGLRNFNDEAKNYSVTKAWLTNLLANYDELKEDVQGMTYIRYRSIVLLYKKASNNFITCYTLSYDTVNKKNDSLNATIAKKKLNLDNATKAKVEETLRSLYYRELRSYSKDLAEYYGKISEMYKGIANNKHNNGVDSRLENIKDYRSIVDSVELKIKSYYDVAYGGQDEEISE